MKSLCGIQLEGRDAEDFLQRVSTAWVKKIRPGQGAKALFLTGTAKVIAPFFLLRPVAERFLLITEPENQERLFAGLEALHFAEDLSLSLLPGTGGITKDPVPGSEHFSDKDHELSQEIFPISMQEEAMFFPFPIAGAFGFLNSTGVSPVSAEELEQERISAMIPFYKKEWNQDSNALDVGFLPWIHRGKGCYPGQEVVERSLNVGHPARSLVLLEAAIPLQAGDQLFIDDKSIGTITSAFAKSALAIVQWKHRDAGTQYRVQRQNTFLGEARCLK